MSELPLQVTEAFTSAALTALQELVQLEAFAEQLDDATGPSVAGPVVIATIRLLRDPVGSMSLLMATETAVSLASRYLPTGTALVPELIDDVAGEFANVIAGQAKTMLKGTPYHFSLSTPTTQRADTLLPRTSSNPDLNIRLTSEIGQIELQTFFSQVQAE